MRRCKCPSSPVPRRDGKCPSSPFFGSCTGRESSKPGGQVVAAPWASCPSVRWGLKFEPTMSEARYGGKMILLQVNQVNLFYKQSMLSRGIYKKSMQSRGGCTSCSLACRGGAWRCRWPSSPVPRRDNRWPESTCSPRSPCNPEGSTRCPFQCSGGRTNDGGDHHGGALGGGEEERSHTDPATTLALVGLRQSLTWLNPTHYYIYQSWPSGTYVTNL